MAKSKPKCSCLNCKKEISVNNIHNHYLSKACKELPKELPEVLDCQYCGKSCKNHNSWRNHKRTCPSNPSRKYKNGMQGKKPWNYGLTDDDPRVHAYTSKIRAFYNSGNRHYHQTSEYWTEARRLEASKKRKKFYKENPELHPNRLLAHNRSQMTYPEKVAYDFLIKSGIEFDHQTPIATYYVDFCIGKVIIEIDGEYWHPEGNEHDMKRDAILSDLGYTVYRIKSSERIQQRIKDILSVV